MNFRNSFEKIDILLAATVTVFVFLLIFLTSDAIGFVRDEGFYMKAAINMADWYESINSDLSSGEFSKIFSKKEVDKYFNYNSEHPPFMKELFGLSQFIFTRKLGVLSAPMSARLVAAVFAALTALVIYIFGLIFFSRMTASVAPFLFFTMPHIFFHSHLACFDMPILFFWSSTFILYIFCLKSNRTSLHALTALFFAFGMATKHNVLFIPIVLFVSWLFFYAFSYRKESGKNSFTGFFKAIPKIFYFMVIISLPVYFLIWPRMWFNTFDRLMTYAEFHGKHVNYLNYYFGTPLKNGPFPFSFPWVMTFFTTPTPQLVCFFAGTFYFCRDFLKSEKASGKEAAFAMITGSLFPIFLIALPSVPIFGGIKHWFTGYPLMLTAGVFVIEESAKKLIKTNNFKKSLIVAAVFLIAAVSVVPLNIKFAKRGAAFYNELIGGAQGAAEMRMQRNFWGYDMIDLAETLNREAPVKAKLYIMTGYEGLNQNSFKYMQEAGLIRNDIKATNALNEADFALFFYEKQNEHILNNIAYEFGTVRPLAVSSTDSVFYSALFRREK
jgi:4-amino-4-deoxy-L-arabinose transferase and related glycosyltransferases of PMT family